MKFTIAAFEGTPEELESPAALSLLAALHEHAGSMFFSIDPASRRDADPSNAADTAELAPVPGVAEEGQATVRHMLEGNPAGELMVRFLETTTSWSDVHALGIKRRGSLPSAPLDYSRYLRLRKVPSQFGGFAYVFCSDGWVNFRLQLDTDAELAAVAKDAVRLTTGHREYRVSLQIVDGSTLEQALKLARTAYDAT